MKIGIIMRGYDSWFRYVKGHSPTLFQAGDAVWIVKENGDGYQVKSLRGASGTFIPKDFVEVHSEPLQE